MRIQLPTELPEGREKIRDHLKLIVSQAPMDVQGLEQPAIKPTLSPLESLLHQALSGQKQFARVQVQMDDWATALQSIEVVK